MIARSFDGESEGITPDDFLDNVTFYWLTNTAISSARLYWDTTQVAKGGFFDVRGLKIPVAVSAFPDEIYQAIRIASPISASRLEAGGLPLTTLPSPPATITYLTATSLLKR